VKQEVREKKRIFPRVLITDHRIKVEEGER
jgi:hypothetical protein